MKDRWSKLQSELRQGLPCKSVTYSSRGIHFEFLVTDEARARRIAAEIAAEQQEQEQEKE